MSDRLFVFEDAQEDKNIVEHVFTDTKEAPKMFQVFHQSNFEQVELKKSTQNVWTSEEDKKLLELVQATIGRPNWNEISECFTNKTSRQCRIHYTEVLDPKLDRKPLTKKEISLVFDLHKKYGNKWTKIAKEVGKPTQMVRYVVLHPKNSE